MLDSSKTATTIGTKTSKNKKAFSFLGRKKKSHSQRILSAAPKVRSLGSGKSQVSDLPFFAESEEETSCAVSSSSLSSLTSTSCAPPSLSCRNSMFHLVPQHDDYTDYSCSTSVERLARDVETLLRKWNVDQGADRHASLLSNKKEEKEERQNNNNNGSTTPVRSNKQQRQQQTLSQNKAQTPPAEPNSSLSYSSQQSEYFSPLLRSSSITWTIYFYLPAAAEAQHHCHKTNHNQYHQQHAQKFSATVELQLALWDEPPERRQQREQQQKGLNHSNDSGNNENDDRSHLPYSLQRIPPPILTTTTSSRTADPLAAAPAAVAAPLWLNCSTLFGIGQHITLTPAVATAAVDHASAAAGDDCKEEDNWQHLLQQYLWPSTAWRHDAGGAAAASSSATSSSMASLSLQHTLTQLLQTALNLAALQTNCQIPVFGWWRTPISSNQETTTGAYNVMPSPLSDKKDPTEAAFWEDLQLPAWLPHHGGGLNGNESCKMKHGTRLTLQRQKLAQKAHALNLQHVPPLLSGTCLAGPQLRVSFWLGWLHQQLEPDLGGIGNSSAISRARLAAWGDLLWRYCGGTIHLWQARHVYGWRKRQPLQQQARQQHRRSSSGGAKSQNLSVTLKELGDDEDEEADDDDDDDGDDEFDNLYGTPQSSPMSRGGKSSLSQLNGGSAGSGTAHKRQPRTPQWRRRQSPFKKSGKKRRASTAAENSGDLLLRRLSLPIANKTATGGETGAAATGGGGPPPPPYYRQNVQEQILELVSTAAGASADDPLWGPMEDPIAAVWAKLTWAATPSPSRPTSPPLPTRGEHKRQPVQPGAADDSVEQPEPLQPLLQLPLKIRSSQVMSKEDWVEAEEAMETSILNPTRALEFVVRVELDTSVVQTPLAAMQHCVLAALIRTSTLPSETLLSHLIDATVLNKWDTTAGNVIAMNLSRRAKVGQTTTALVQAMDWDFATEDMIEPWQALDIVRSVLDDMMLQVASPPEDNLPQLLQEAQRDSLLMPLPKAAPFGRLFSILCAYISRVRSPSSMVQVFTTFCQELRRRWDFRESLPNMNYLVGVDPPPPLGIHHNQYNNAGGDDKNSIPCAAAVRILGLPTPPLAAYSGLVGVDAEPDDYHCMIGQKLQVFNLCLETVIRQELRQVARLEKARSPFGPTAGLMDAGMASSDDDTADFASVAQGPASLSRSNSFRSQDAASRGTPSRSNSFRSHSSSAGGAEDDGIFLPNLGSNASTASNASSSSSPQAGHGNRSPSPVIMFESGATPPRPRKEEYTTPRRPSTRGPTPPRKKSHRPAANSPPRIPGRPVPTYKSAGSTGGVGTGGGGGVKFDVQSVVVAEDKTVQSVATKVSSSRSAKIFKDANSEEQVGDDDDKHHPVTSEGEGLHYVGGTGRLDARSFASGASAKCSDDRSMYSSASTKYSDATQSSYHSAFDGAKKIGSGNAKPSRSGFGGDDDARSVATKNTAASRYFDAGQSLATRSTMRSQYYDADDGDTVSKEAGWSNRRRGARCPIQGQVLKETGDQVFAPYLQRPLPLTDDLVEERKQLFEAASSADATEKDWLERLEVAHRIQRPKLWSDMSAFKAANPGCELSDFTRWYGEPTNPLEHYQPSYGAAADGLAVSAQQQCEAKRSILLLENTREFWNQTWQEARPIPALEQDPLFSASDTVEIALDYLETLHPANLICSVMAANLSNAYFSLVISAGDAATQLSMVQASLTRLRRKIEIALNLLSRDSTRHFGGRSSSHGYFSYASLETLGACETACRTIGEVEILLSHALSLTTKFPDQTELVEHLLCKKQYSVPNDAPRQRLAILESLLTIRQYQPRQSSRPNRNHPISGEYLFRNADETRPCQLSVRCGSLGDKMGGDNGLDGGLLVAMTRVEDA